MSRRTEKILEFTFSILPQSVSAILLLAAISVNFTNVVSRYIFRSSIYWADEAMIFLIIWSVLTSAVAIAYQGRLLEMDLVVSALPDWLKKPIALAVNACTMAIFFFMSWQAAVAIKVFISNDQRTIALNIPMAIPHSALLFGFCFCGLAIAVRIATSRYVPHKKTAEEIMRDAI